MPIDHPFTFLALLTGFAGLLYFAFSRDVRGKGIAQFAIPLAFAVASATFFIPSASDAVEVLFAVGLSFAAPYIVYRQLVFCRCCGSSGSLFSPLTVRDSKCKDCGAPLGKPPNTSLERTRER